MPATDPTSLSQEPDQKHKFEHKEMPATEQPALAQEETVAPAPVVKQQPPAPKAGQPSN